MKARFLILFSICCFVLSCTKHEDVVINDGTGYINFNLSQDPSLIMVNTRVEDPIYKVKILNSADVAIKTYDNHKEITGPIALNPGKYTVVGIETEAFYNSLFTSITLPSTIKHIGDSVFAGKILETISLPKSLVSIGIASFQSCENLVSIDIPETVTTIGYSAFENSFNLNNVVASVRPQKDIRITMRSRILI